ncbi:uncharacterized protein [Rutidosis leptorrhynchoides]|uniref:uncharacterized protein n=1 Tax=Rutidosis leptorrhynchoides TaxID=125765 RepID=UPI003A994BE3
MELGPVANQYCNSLNTYTVPYLVDAIESVLDHNIPTTTDDSSSTTTPVTPTQPPALPANWDRLDSIVLQWIYGTISLDLLRTVYKEDSTAQQAWDCLKGIFHDNRNSRAVHLQHQFTNTRIENFPDASAYCQELKLLADQLGNVGPAIEEDILVLQLITGLNDSGRGSYRGGNNRGRNNRGRGRGNQSFHSGNTQFQNQGFNSGQNQLQKPPWTYGPWAWTNAQWAPPCPFPATPWTCPTTNQPGLLGPRPTANYASSVSSQPTDLEAAMHTMTLNPPDDNWYLDTGTMSYMTNNQGNLLFYYPSTMTKHIIVGNGHGLPIHGFGHTCLNLPPSDNLHLKNVLHSPPLIKNLISGHRLAIDNDISIDFEPFGFTVKEFSKGTPIARYNSTDDLYPFHPSLMRPIQNKTFAFSASSSDLWHHRLGHPGLHLQCY